MINRKNSLGILCSVFTLILCTASYAEDSQSVSLTDTQQAAHTTAQLSSHDQEMMEKFRLVREADREREAQQRQEAQIARQKQIDDIMQHRHYATSPQSFNPTESRFQTEQLNSPTTSTTHDQTNKTTNTLPKFLVLLALIGLAIFWLKNSRKTSPSATYRNKTKTASSRQNINNNSIQKNLLLKAEINSSTIHVDTEVEHALAYLRHYAPMPKWIDPNSDNRITLGDNEKQKQEGPVWKVVHSGFMVSFVIDQGKSLRGINIPTLTRLGMTYNELYRIALKNLDIHVYEKVKSGIQIAQSKDKHYHRLILDGDFDSSLLLLDKVWNHMDLRKLTPNGAVVAIPDRGTLLFCDAAKTNSIKIMHDEAKKVVAASESKITERLFIRRHHRWTEYTGAEVLTSLQQLQKKYGDLVLPQLFRVQHHSQWHPSLHNVPLSVEESGQRLSKELAPTQWIAKMVHGGLAVSFVKYGKTDDGMQGITDLELAASGLTLDELEKIAFENLFDLSGAGRDGVNLEIKTHGHIFKISLIHDNYPEAGFLLLDSLWDEQVKSMMPNLPIAVIPSQNHLAFCDSTSQQGIEELRKYANDHLSFTDQEAGFSQQLYIREGGLWKPYVAVDHRSLIHQELSILQ
jgi:uncharacterized protein YtpQ (UPF0354 family)